MKRITYIVSVLLVAYVAFVSCEREDVERPEEMGGRPIEFVVESEWPEMTKATTSIDAFNVWGNWAKDPNDVSNTSVIEEDVWGRAGTKVIKYGNTWMATEGAEWYQGYYNFAAIYPSYFTGFQEASYTQNQTDENSVTRYSDLLTINLGEDGLDLSADQVNMMYAFSCVDNSNNDASAVNLRFTHAFALLTVKLQSKSGSYPAITKVSVYGIHSKIYGNIEFEHVQELDGTLLKQSVVKNNLSQLLRDHSSVLSTQSTPYAEFTFGSSMSGEEVTIIDKLIVFPETLSAACSLRVKLECASGDTIYTEIDSGQWSSGSNNVYVLAIE